MKHGLKESDIASIVESITGFDEIDEAVLFGSRAKGNFKNGSDVDLAIRGDGITHDTVASLTWILNEERPLPYFFDIIDYEKIREPELKAHIDRIGVVIYRAGNDRVGTIPVQL